MTKRVALLACISLLGTVVLILVPPASAHECCDPEEGFYAYRWKSNSTPRMRPTPQFIGNNRLRTAKVAARRWNDSQTGFAWVFEQKWSSNFNPWKCPQRWSNGTPAYQKNGLHYRDLPNALGKVKACTRAQATPGADGYDLHTAQIVIDSSPSDGNATWYCEDPLSGYFLFPSASEFDCLSVMRHEFGHAAGSLKGSKTASDKMGHFKLGLSICPRYGASNRHSASQTMCQGPIYPGEYYPRDLKTHDKHTIEAAY